MKKQPLRFKIKGNSYAYEGMNTTEARTRDILDLMVKAKLDKSLTPQAFKDNIPEVTMTDDEAIKAYEEAAARRAARKGGGGGGGGGSGDVAPPPAAESKDGHKKPDEALTQMVLVIQGKKYAYEGYPSQKQAALVEFLVKANLSEENIEKAFHDNVPGTTMARPEMVRLVEDRRKAREARKKKETGASSSSGSSSGGNSSGPSSGNTTSLASKEKPGNPNLAGEVNDMMNDHERSSIDTFIKEVLELPGGDIGGESNLNLGGLPTMSHLGAPPGSISRNSNHFVRNLNQHVDENGRIAIYCHEEGDSAHKLLHVQKGVSFNDVIDQVEKKYGKRMCLSFYENDSKIDKIDIDDDDVLQMFFEQNVPKLRLIVAPAALRNTVKDDQLTAAASSQRVAPSQITSANTVTHTDIRGFAGHSAAVYCVSWSDRGNKFCSSSRDRSVRVWDIENGGCKTMRGGHNGFALSCDFAPGGEFLVSSSDDRVIKIWNADTGVKVMSIRGHEDKVYCVQYNSTGAYIASGSCDRTVRLWSADSGSKVAVLKGHSLPVFSVCFSHTDAGRYVVSGSDDRLVKIWDWREGKEVRTLMGHTGTVWSAQYSHNDRYVVSATMDHEIWIWDAATGRDIRRLLGHNTPVHHAIFSPCDRYILSCARDWSVMVWDRETGERADTILGHGNTVFHLALNRDNSLLTSSLDNSIRLHKMTFNK